MSRTSPGPRGGFTRPASGPLHRLLNLATLFALIGVALSAVILWLHGQIESGGAAYTSFCTLSSTVDCDVVLSSSYAKLFGIPIAWPALAAYGALAVLFQVAARASGPLARRALQLACAGSIGAAAFSVYMAFISFAVLNKLCLMCSGLYVVSLGLLVVALMLPSRFARSEAAGSPPLTAGAMAALGVVAVLAVAGLAGAAWYRPSESFPADVTLEQLRQADPEFYDWYVALPVVAPPPGDARHVLGDVAAPVTIVEFSDFECAYCARNHAILNDLVARQPEIVRVVYRHFPLDAACNDVVETSVHSRACRAAEAAECAGVQGRFHEMADALFADQRRLFEENLYQIAAQVGVDGAEFRRCMSEHATRPRVSADAQAGSRLELRSTPTLFINGRKVVGSLPDLDAYEHAVLIESRLKS